MAILTRCRIRSRPLVVALVLTAVAGCGPQTLETSSVEALQLSLQDLTDRMTADDLARFDEALGYLVGDDRAPEATRDTAVAESLLPGFQALTGRTAEGIVAEARFRRIREVRSAVILLETERAESEAARRELASFRFMVARVFKRHKNFLDWPVIEIKVDNGFEHTVSLVRFRAALLRPDDVQPWLLEEIDHVVFGGMAPGQRDVWRIEPEQRDWIQLIDPHPELSFSLEVTRLQALGGRVLAATTWGGVEAHRLAIYQRTLKAIRSSGGLALDRPPAPAAAGRTVPPSPS